MSFRSVFRLKQIDKFIVKSYLGPFVATFFVAIFILLMQFIWKYIDDLVGKGLEWYIIVELLFYTSATIVPLALPLAILLSSIMTFGNLGEFSELTAIKAAGISLRRVMRPLLYVSIFLSIAAFLFSNYMLPQANLRMRVLLWDVRQQKPALNIKEGVFYSEIDGYVIKIRKKDADGQTIGDVMIYDHTNKNGQYNVTMAKKGKMVMSSDKKFLLFTLFDGNNYIENRSGPNKMNKYPFQRTFFQKQFVKFDLSSFQMNRSSDDMYSNGYQMLNVSQIDFAVDSMLTNHYQVQADLVKDVKQRFVYYLDFTKNKKFLSSLVNNNPQPINPDFIENFPKEKQQQIFDFSLNHLRSQKEYAFSINDRLDGNLKYIYKFLIEWHRKFTLSFACLVLFFIGAPLGAIIRRGGFGLPMVASVLLFVIFHILSITGEKMVKEAVVTPFEGMWMASFVLLPVGLLLTIQATADLNLLTKEGWSRIFGKKIKLK